MDTNRPFCRELCKGSIHVKNIIVIGTRPQGPHDGRNCLTEACRLREEYRIVGVLTGCLPRAPKQNVFLSLPLQLRPEEATLLRDRGVCRFLDGSRPVKLPTQEEVEAFQNHRKQCYEEQVALCKEEKKKEMLLRRDEIIEGKKAKRLKLLKQRQEAGEEIPEEELNKEVEFNVDDINIAPLPEKSSLVQICGATPNQGPETEPEYTDWTFPDSDAEKLRYRVFCDLWEKGYYLTNGCKFGADFLAYPGDPIRYHSFYIVICVPYHENRNVMKLATLGRLGTSVKKTVLLCSVDDTDKLCYTSLQWTGISY